MKKNVILMVLSTVFPQEYPLINASLFDFIKKTQFIGAPSWGSPYGCHPRDFGRFK
jgi:hypothetical protein